MIRPVTPAETPTLLDLTAATGFFKPHEVDTLQLVLDDLHQGRGEGGRCFVLEEGESILGFVYHAPEPMTEGSWSLWWIVVRTDIQGHGLGARLLKFAEQDSLENGARVLFVETSNLPHYEPTRQFYLKRGYEQEARLRDYYAEGDDQIIFRKRLQ
jgi:GNAT superfamily N-acetyltransferase